MIFTVAVSPSVRVTPLSLHSYLRSPSIFTALTAVWSDGKSVPFRFNVNGNGGAG